MKTTNTDLRAEFDNMFYFDTGYRGERIEALNNDTETLWNWIQANHISRKDAVSKSEVMELIERNRFSVFVEQADKVVTAVKYLPLRNLLTEGHSPDGNQPSAGLTEVDKPNKEN